MRKLILLVCIAALCGLTPARKVLLSGYSPAAEEAFIASQSPTADINIPAAEVERGPIVHLLMEDNAASTAVVNKANVAINGTASANTSGLSTTSNCAVSRCLDFDGTTTLVDLGSDLIGTGADSACAWHRADGNHETAGWLVGNGNFLLVNTANGQTLSLYCEGATAATTGAVLTQGTLYHFCATRTAAGVANLYVNGVLTGAANQSCGVPSGVGSSNVIIGNSAGATRTINGKIDDVRIYDYALSPAQISAIYNNGVGHQNLASKAKADMMTVDSLRRVSSVVGKQGIEFYQSTLASQPVQTLSDNRENQLLYSQDISQVSGTTYWQYTRATNISATEFKDDATPGATHRIFQARPAIVSGSIYAVGVSVKRGTGTRNFRLLVDYGSASADLYVNLADGGTVSSSGYTSVLIEADPADATYWRVATTITANSAAAGNINAYLTDAAHNATYNGDNASSLFLTRAYFRSSLSDSTYTPTTTHALYRGMAGKQALRFDGDDDVMRSSTTFASIYTTTAKTLFSSLRPAIVTGGYLLYGPNAYMISRFDSSNYEFRNYDANQDSAAYAITANKNQIVFGLHDGTNIYAGVNRGVSAAVASGTTGGGTSDSLYLGASEVGTGEFNGLIQRLTTFNKVLSPYARDRISKHLCKQAGASCN
jgi:hypothetical protein